MNARFTPAIIYSEAFTALDWASADLQLDTLPNRPQSVPCRLHVHNGSGGVQNLYLVTKGGIRSTYACPPGAFPYPIDIRAQKIGFGSGANLTVTADWPHDGISADFISHPSQVEGLVAWYGDTVTGAGTAAYSVRDLSGNGNHGTQATTAAQPTVSSGQLDFDAATSQFYSVSTTGMGVTGASKFAMIIRSTNSADVPAGNQHMVNSAAAGQIAFGQLLSTSGDVRFAFAGGAIQSIPGASVTASDENAYTLLFDSGVQTVRLNGSVVVTGAAGISVLPTISTIRVGGTTGVFWDGQMRNVFIVTGRIPTENELAYLENYGV